jgi:hypothetical protein
LGTNSTGCTEWERDFDPLTELPYERNIDMPTEHRWSGWPGAWCLDCGIVDPRECQLADGNYEVDEDGMPVLHITPEMMECKEPGSRRFDPYKTREEIVLDKYSTPGLKKNNLEG